MNFIFKLIGLILFSSCICTSNTTTSSFKEIEFLVKLSELTNNLCNYQSQVNNDIITLRKCRSTAKILLAIAHFSELPEDNTHHIQLQQLDHIIEKELIAYHQNK